MGLIRQCSQIIELANPGGRRAGILNFQQGIPNDGRATSVWLWLLVIGGILFRLPSDPSKERTCHGSR